MKAIVWDAGFFVWDVVWGTLDLRAGNLLFASFQYTIAVVMLWLLFRALDRWESRR